MAGLTPNSLPLHVLEKLYMKVSIYFFKLEKTMELKSMKYIIFMKIYPDFQLEPGIPERLRLTCKNLNAVYETVEGKLPREKMRNTVLFISVHSSSGELYLEFRNYTNGRVHHPVESANFQKLRKFMKLAEVLKFSMISDFKVVIENDSKEIIIRDLLKEYPPKKVRLDNSYPISTMKIADLFGEPTNFRLYIPQNTLGELRMATMQRVSFDVLKL